MRKLRSVESLDTEEVKLLLPELAEAPMTDEERVLNFSMKINNKVCMYS